MELDDEICLCFHVTKRKVLHFIQIEKPRRSGQLSECYGAGTGCGWCRAHLERLFCQMSGKSMSEDVTSDEYARLREQYLLQRRVPAPRDADEGP